ncbi:hypothetical protein BOTBODRAFT_53780 [Botryobasidium botryosum FD-172 SS1]|uniref:Rhodanese domain-containing protein n=1 Tax=Botryobasidium botryosum (strain FD-172 SS1) TaxID=930990 RepID=A0A067MXR2_BOTB1|nr:hypothetical protein BOTBODRAFT_53780 [Botryobasidium botryosum FD-172 SS1]
MSAPAWYEALPAPRSQPPHITPDALAELIRTKEARKDYIVVDVRRTDFEHGYVKGAINLPAQSFNQALPGLVPILSNIPLVVFYCNRSTGRGPRCAGWYADALPSGTKSQSLVLEGGIKGWLSKWGEDESLSVSLPPSTQTDESQLAGASCGA